MDKKTRNNHTARYLRVPSVPCTGSSADSVLSSSSGHMLSGGSIPPTPGTMSSASSVEDVGGAVSEDFRKCFFFKYYSSQKQVRVCFSLFLLLHYCYGSAPSPLTSTYQKPPTRREKNSFQTHTFSHLISCIWSNVRRIFFYS